MPCAPQRFLANNRNAIREAVLAASSVLPKANSVFPIPTARTGTAQVQITGDYTGDGDATYDFEIVDDDVETPLISAPVFSGAGSGTLTDISADLSAQEITVELSESGVPLLAAATDFEGVTLKARTAGAAGNSIHIHVDQSPLTFTPQDYSLLRDLAAGAGGQDSPLSGSEYDFDTAILGADNAIPTAAHRVSFGDDRSAVYLQYKAYKDGAWSYYFVPALKRDVPKGTVVNFVTGGRTVTIYPGSTPETYTDIVTLYDLLIAIKTQSALIDVDGVVANDRSPTGQASQELQTRTDAHAQPSFGAGSDSALGFENVSVASNAGTQLVIATCRAVGPEDHPLAHVGKTRWELSSSLLGALGTIVEGEDFSGRYFGLRIPVRLPYNFGSTAQKGRFEVTGISYVARSDGDPDPPPICPVALTLGPAAVDQTLTLVYTKRPSGDCDCSDLPIPDLNTSCLGNVDLTAGDSMSDYQTDTIARLKDLREWFTGVVRAQSAAVPTTNAVANYSTIDSFIDAAKVPATTDANLPASGEIDGAYDQHPKSLTEVVDMFERALAQIDPLEGGTPSLRGDGCLAWDDAVSELKDDVAAFVAAASITLSIPAARYTARIGFVLMCAGISQVSGAASDLPLSGDGCWRDNGDPYYWSVSGSAAGGYAPAFSNVPYYSSRPSGNKGQYFSTKEFAFQLNIKCPDDLREGDTITLVIGNAQWPSTYQIGDTLTLPIVGASDLYLAGGQDASLVQTWLVNGSLAGPFPSFAYDPDSPTPYSDATVPTLSFTLTPGGIDFEKGDRFAFSIEGGHYKWRKDEGAWQLATPPEPIPIGPVLFDEGLSVEFVTGAAPSFAAGDRFSFRARQPWSVENVRTPNVQRWKWDEANPVFEATFAPIDIDSVAIAFHTIPEGAAILLEGGAGGWDWSESVTWREGVIAHLLSETREAQDRLRLTFTDATDGSIGWIWAGVGFATTRSADSLPRPSTKFARGEGGLYQGGRFLGKGVAGNVEWSESGLTEADVAGLLELFYWVKEHNDEPLVFLPQYTRPEDAFAVRIASDDVEFPDLFGYQPDADAERLQGGTLTLAAVYR